jgi:hypothetical protein
MSWNTCPICDHKNPRTLNRCAACGADFDDPDVRAMAGVEPGPAATLAPSVGALATARFLGVSLDGLADGHALRRLGVALAAVLAVGFLIPLTADYHKLHFAWSQLEHGAAFALLLPLVAVALGLVAALGRGLPPAAVAAGFALVGLAGVVSLPTLGRFGGAPQALVPLHAIGLVVAGGALVVRLARPDDRAARLALTVGAALAVIGLFVKLGAGGAMPFELGGAAASDASPGMAWLDALSVQARNPFVLFAALAIFVPALAAGVAAALAWPAGSGPWDRSALPLRVLGALVLLAPALVAAELAFNMTGWSERGVARIDGRWVELGDLMSGAVIGRLRMGVLGAGYAVMAGFGLAALYLTRRPRSGS